MDEQAKTGSVTSKSGKVIIGGKAVVGIELQGAVSDETVQTAIKVLQQLQTGGISGDKGVEIKGDFISGLSFRYFDPAQPTPETFLAELKLLRQQVAELAAGQEEALTEAQAAVTSLDETIAEAEKEKPLTRRLIGRLQETVGFITDAGKALEAAGKAGPLIAQALGTATVLYQAAQSLF